MSWRSTYSFPFDDAARPGAAVVGAAAGAHQPPALPVAVPSSAASAVPAPPGVMGRRAGVHHGQFLPALGRGLRAPASFGAWSHHDVPFFGRSAITSRVARGASRVVIRKGASVGKSEMLCVFAGDLASGAVPEESPRRIFRVPHPSAPSAPAPTAPAHLVILIARGLARQGWPLAILPGAAS